MVKHLDWMAQIKAVLPPASVLSGEAPQERRKKMVSSDADRAADISGVIPSLASGCKEALMMILMRMIHNKYSAVQFVSPGLDCTLLSQ